MKLKPLGDRLVVEPMELAVVMKMANVLRWM